MRVVGLTGGIACGKSTVAKLLEGEHGMRVIDCDKIAQDVCRQVGCLYRMAAYVGHGGSHLGAVGRVNNTGRGNPPIGTLQRTFIEGIQVYSLDGTVKVCPPGAEHTSRWRG